ncbi:unnamed protein product [Ilex paraguariensis]|uniref:RING-type E3 ubiquitin transferase n=1 Tax=Ilex paraguariensis TaxID=185542 RepID=A0ABC8REI9_9AQUA
MNSSVGLCCFSFFLPFIFFAYSALCVEICNPSSCGRTGPPVRFPFRLKDRQADRCGYRGFDLSCNNQGQTVLTLPSSGEFIVTSIDYVSQAIYIDPDFCFPEKILNFSLSGSHFRGANFRNYTFLNCSSDWSRYPMYHFLPLLCQDGGNYTVVATISEWLSVDEMPSECRIISTVEVPAQSAATQYWSSLVLYEDLQLIWVAPRCNSCEARGGICGYKSDTGLETGCSRPTSKQGLPRSAKYGIIIGIGIPGIVCLIGLVCYICNRIRGYEDRRYMNTELSAITIPPQRVLFATGLDGPTIASFPKTVLGESRRLPNSSDSTCPICLSEYQPKDALRTIPDCNHYFHAKCIDEWLKLNATCPLCRNSPDGSSLATSRSSTSSTFSSPSSS